MMRAARLAIGAAVALAAGGGAVVLASGGDPGDARADRWTALAPAPLARTEVAAARIGRSIYVVGGFERDSGATSAAVERYDIRRNRWSRVRSMPLALNHATAVAHRGDLYVHGGYTGASDLSAPTGALLRYDPERGRWRRLPSSPTPRAAHALAAIGGRLYAAGGANDSGSLRSLEIYDLERRRWTQRPELPVRAGPQPHHGGRRGRPLLCDRRPRRARTSRPSSATTRAGASGRTSPTCARRAAASRRRGCATAASSSSAART